MKKNKIGIIGLGYVGLPLAFEFSMKFETIGFDINKKRVDELNSGYDSTQEVDGNKLSLLLTKKLLITDDKTLLSDCNVFIVTVPTPVDENKRPDLTPIIKASETVSMFLKNGDYVIYESTVYPGLTEEICVPILESNSSLKLNINFFVGYSPERINPGDKIRTLTNIVKVTSGSNKEAADFIDKLYKQIITAGTFKASSIKVAEAAKVIENSQRDINIAFVNELSKIFNKMEISTNDVLEAASTKWNFLNFKPGLVGGHCIGVDPYYLAQKAQELDYYPEIILSGRKLNDGMSDYIVNEFVKFFLKKNIDIKNSKIIILGVTFKENCPDTRNSKVFDIISKLNSLGINNLDVFDPYVDTSKEIENQNINFIREISLNKIKLYDGIIYCVNHKIFNELGVNSSNKKVVFDIKDIFKGKIKVDFKL